MMRKLLPLLTLGTPALAQNYYMMSGDMWGWGAILMPIMLAIGAAVFSVIFWLSYKWIVMPKKKRR